MNWKSLDTVQILAQRQQQREATMSGNVGAFAVPLGAVLRPAMGVPVNVPRGPHYGSGMAPSQGYQSLDDALNAYAKATKR